MNNTAKIGASVACADPINLGRDIRELEENNIDFLHIDIMDGHFVPNIALNFSIIREIKKVTNLPLECHLMIQDPERYIDLTAQMGASYISVHVEATKHLQRLLAKIRDAGLKSGIALNPATPLDTMDYILDDIDMVTVMTVNPGFAGQKLIPATLDKIRNIRRLLDSRAYENIDILVDGNVSIENIPKMFQAGANLFVGGTSILFRKGYTIQESAALFRSLLQQKIKLVS
jgi:ribulose-phosphate 3-epimerase